MEEARQAIWQDFAYTQEGFYGFSLRGPTGVGSTLSPNPLDLATQFLFPVGPMSIRQTTEYRQTITPTLGGIVTEERGVAWKEIVIEGNFGLSPKMGFDSTPALACNPTVGPPAMPPWMAPMSGPRWTLRMIRHFFDRYAVMKARPDENYATQLVWHNYKDNEHLIVVPIKFELNRTVNDRMMYPFTITMKAIAPTTPTPLLPVPPSVQDVLNGIQNGVRVARAAVNVLTSSVNTLTAAIGRIRSVVATIDSVVDEAATAIDAATTLLETGQRLPDLANAFMSSATGVVESALVLVDTAENFPAEWRQSLRRVADSYDALGAQATFQVTTTIQEGITSARANARDTGLIEGSPTTVGSPAAIQAAGAGATPRRFNQWSGWRPYTIQGSDNLRLIALRELGSADAWYQIAVYNSLGAPYISYSGLPGTAGPGDTILIPAANAAKKTTAATAQDGTKPVDLFGTNLKLYETDGTRPGRPQVDIRLDPKTGKDVAIIEGIQNLVQACQMRLWTERGTYPLDRNFGCPFVVGYPNDATTVLALREAVRAGLSNDSRISRMTGMTVTQDDDTLELEATVVPVGTAESVTVGLTVV
jgi:phage baseplate assembly protein W